MTNHRFLNLTEIGEPKEIKMKQTPGKKETLTTTAFIPGRIEGGGGIFPRWRLGETRQMFTEQ